METANIEHPTHSVYIKMEPEDLESQLLTNELTERQVSMQSNSHDIKAEEINLKEEPLSDTDIQDELADLLEKTEGKFYQFVIT